MIHRKSLLDNQNLNQTNNILIAAARSCSLRAEFSSLYLEPYRIRRDVRVVEGARLESVYTVTYRGFESLPLRQFQVPK